MALNKKQTQLVAFAVVVALLATEASAAITCGRVGATLAPCIPYATGSTGTLTGQCCGGVRSLNSMASSSADRQAVCRCLKSLAGTVGRINMGTVAGVPGKCGVTVPFPLSMSTDCNKVH